MGGRPWLRILAVFAGFALLGWPVWNITHGHAFVPAAVTKTVAAAQHLRVEVSFAQPPGSFQLESAGRAILAGRGPQRDFSGDWAVAVPPEGVELLVKADWPGGTAQTATRVQVFRDDTVLADQTFWVQNKLIDTVTVPGGQP